MFYSLSSLGEREREEPVTPGPSRQPYSLPLQGEGNKAASYGLELYHPLIPLYIPSLL